MSPSEEHDDLYSVEPAAMSDEQIARRDALSIGAIYQAESCAAIAASLNALLGELCKSVDRLQQERDALRAVLREILTIETRTGLYIPASLIERAEKLLAGG